jgi:hypothetical protein
MRRCDCGQEGAVGTYRIFAFDEAVKGISFAAAKVSLGR